MLIRAMPFFRQALNLFPNNLIIYSMWEGYLDEGKPYSDSEKISFLNKAKANGSILIPLHTSGHAYEETILKICGTLKPDVIFPIHSERPDRFEELKNDNKIAGSIKRMEHKETVEI